MRRIVSRDMREYPVCSGCGFVCYLHPKIVAVTIPVRDGRVLLTRRAIEPAHGLWTFPGGYVDWGESVTGAARREMREEVGLDLEPDGLVGIYSYADAPVVIVAYHVTVPHGLEAAADAHEVSETGLLRAGGDPLGRARVPEHARGARGLVPAAGCIVAVARAPARRWRAAVRRRAIRAAMVVAVGLLLVPTLGAAAPRGSGGGGGGSRPRHGGHGGWGAATAGTTGRVTAVARAGGHGHGGHGHGHGGCCWGWGGFACRRWASERC